MISYKVGNAITDRHILTLIAACLIEIIRAVRSVSTFYMCIKAMRIPGNWRTVSVLFLILLAAITMVSCHSDDSPPMPSPQTGALPQLRAEGGELLDPWGRVALLRGVNVPGNYTYPFAYGEEDLDTIRAFGFNFIRLGISWADAEPVEGVYDMAYIESYRDFIREAAERGIYTMPEIHQVNWCIEGGHVPEWMCRERPSNPMDIFRILREADHFWRSEALRAKFIGFWRFLVSNFSDLEGLFGYDILNEPISTYGLIYGVYEWNYLFPFYRDIIEAIREIDPDRPIVLEPNAFSPVLPNYTEPFPFENLVFSPHPYFLHMYDAQGRLIVVIRETPGMVRAKYARYAGEAERMGTPLIMGEYGAPSEGYAFAGPWLKESLRLQDEHFIGSAAWTYSPGDTNWSIVDEQGEPRAFYLEHHRRAYPRLTAGEPIFLESLPWKGRFIYRYQSVEDERLGTEIFVPREMVRSGEIEIQGASGWEYRPDTETLVVMGGAQGDEVSIEVACRARHAVPLRINFQ